MRDRPATGVSFYQRSTPFDGPPVSGKMTSPRIWSLVGNAGAAVTYPCCAKKTMIKVSKVCNECSQKACTPHFQGNLLNLYGYLLTPDQLSIPSAIIKSQGAWCPVQQWSFCQMRDHWNTPNVVHYIFSLNLKCNTTPSTYLTWSTCLLSHPNIPWIWIAESKMRLSYTWKGTKKVDSLNAAMDSIILTPPLLDLSKHLTTRSPTMTQLINLKSPLPATHLSPLFLRIKNILPDAKTEGEDNTRLL